MKVCILSMQRVPNFGSLLQSYALKRMLEQHGHCVAFLDIEPDGEDNLLLGGKNNCFREEKGYEGSILSKLQKLDRYAMNRLRIKHRAKRQNAIFESFRSETLGMDNKSNHGVYDCCVIGSDEVFNCLAAGPWGFTSQLFGNVRQTKCVITYAASCGATVFEDVPGPVREKIRESFCRISAFSVRDKNTCCFVSKMTDQCIFEHLDPALVYDFDEEIRGVELPKELPEKYCVIYSYYNRFHDLEDIRRIKQFCKKHNMKIVSVGAPQMWIKDHLVLSPFEALKVFQQAAFVITDTFHGTIFAAKYVSKFAVLVRRSNANKLGDLVARMQLQSHLIQTTDELEAAFSQKNDTTRIRKISEEGRANTNRYLADHVSFTGRKCCDDK